MKPFLTAVIITVVMSISIIYFDPASVFYHGMECSGGIGGGCDTSTATGGIFKWMSK